MKVYFSVSHYPCVVGRNKISNNSFIHNDIYHLRSLKLFKNGFIKNPRKLPCYQRGTHQQADQHGIACKLCIHVHGKSFLRYNPNKISNIYRLNLCPLSCHTFTEILSYLMQAAYFDRDGVALQGFAKRFRENSDEEREHAQKFIDYQ